jgi:leucyl aminopeptidase
MTELVRLEIADGASPEAEVLVAGCFEGEEPSVPDLPDELARAVARAARRSGFAGREKQLVEAPVHGGADAGSDDDPATVVILYGLGSRDDFDFRRMASWIERALEALRTNGVQRAAWAVPDCPEARGESAAERICRRLVLGAYRFDRYRKEAGCGPVRLERITVLAPEGEGETYRRVVGLSTALAGGVVLTRDLANSPANVADPAWMESQARELASEMDMKIDVIGVEELEERGMGGILAVGRGSAVPPRLVRLEWGSEGPVVALVGKGVTFDTGGISIKPAARMDEMKYDKSGACTVLGVARVVAELGLPIRLRVYVPLAENMPDGASYRPGDIIRSYDGKTIEIINTDAEGRLLLADAIALAMEEGPDALIEFSTLTGACVVALGNHGAGLYTPNDELARDLLECAEAGGERLWRLPLWSEFHEEMKGLHADLKNSGGRWGGANTAAAFLANFMGDHSRWAHVDIAGPAQVPKSENGSKGGATGYGVATTVHWLRRFIQAAG